MKRKHDAFFTACFSGYFSNIGIPFSVQNSTMNQGTDMTTKAQFGFTPTEHEVWELRFLVHTPASISSILNIEQRTVDIHLKQCLIKCQQHIHEDAGQPQSIIKSQTTAKRTVGTTVRTTGKIHEKGKSNVNRSQRKYPPVVFAPVPEFAAFYL